MRGGNEDTDTQREDHVRLQQEGGHLQAEEKGPGGNQTSQHLSLRHPASRIVRNLIPV